MSRHCKLCLTIRHLVETALCCPLKAPHMRRNSALNAKKIQQMKTSLWPSKYLPGSMKQATGPLFTGVTSTYFFIIFRNFSPGKILVRDNLCPPDCPLRNLSIVTRKDLPILPRWKAVLWGGVDKGMPEGWHSRDNWRMRFLSYNTNFNVLIIARILIKEPRQTLALKTYKSNSTECELIRANVLKNTIRAINYQWFCVSAY